MKAEMNLRGFEKTVLLSLMNLLMKLFVLKDKFYFNSIKKRALIIQFE
jgi:hypothetical protein